MWLRCSSHQWLCCWAPTQFDPQKSHQTHNSLQPIFEQLVLCSIQVPHPTQPQHSMLTTTRVSVPSHKKLAPLTHWWSIYVKGCIRIIEVHRKQVNNSWCLQEIRGMGYLCTLQYNVCLTNYVSVLLLL